MKTDRLQCMPNDKTKRNNSLFILNTDKANGEYAYVIGLISNFKRQEVANDI